MLIDGKSIAQEIINNLKNLPKQEKSFAAILVGNAPASINFLEQKEKVAEDIGVNFKIYKFPETIKNDELRKEALKITLMKKVGGVIIQLPLPDHINRQYVLNAIPREKDVDVLGERALGAFYAGRNLVLPPSVGVVEKILQSVNYELMDKSVAIVGLGFLIGKPIANWLIGKCQKIYLLDKGFDSKILKQAHLIITGVGRAGIIKTDMLKEEAGIIDFGYSFDENGKIRGDFDFNSLVASGRPRRTSPKAGYPLNFYTPVPGGAGPILVAKLFENFYKLLKVF